ncbi:hypothetical protein AJ80_02945 [Polytolypa hystricis UAMH7299]|uniref:Catalase n=1 Tax=Polytolypa hystricis (strain UAMH7299) TaxID=1447883 RepID=A0A2B7YPB5_POLH7|nr:hypothetical protein AJ80_02945 [Polytolypa hystricis UAMH7299]
MRLLGAILASATIVSAACPYMSGDVAARSDGESSPHVKRQNFAENPNAAEATEEFFKQFYLKDDDSYMTSDVGGPMADQNSLKAGERGPTLLEDFIFRQKIQHFDHERVPERAVHARGAGAHGVFTSYGDFSNITAASFLSTEGKQTPMFVRFSTVAGNRGSADTARDLHGFATRFYTDEGNFDIVGNNAPVFFIQDAIHFPDLVHAVKPNPDSEIPQAATAHDRAYDFFSQQPSSLHALFWAMAGHGIVRSYRHMDGFGVHTYRLVTEDGKSKFVKWHWKTLQGKASLLWEEAQTAAGKNADFHRQDLFDSIAAGRFPEWELSVQIFEEEDQLRWGFDVLDPTKLIPEDKVPLTKLGKMQLNRNPINYFAETEQVMFQPGHIVRGIDFSDDPLLQGRLFSYLDTQLNRNGGPNFEQIPINSPRVPFHNNNRDGAGQMFIPLNTAAYSPNTLNGGSPKQANQKEGKGFFTAPTRKVNAGLVRAASPTFADVWSQPRLFYKNLLPQEQQMLINGLRFEISQLKSQVVRDNIIIQLNRIDNNLAKRVARVVGVAAPEPDSKYYHSNTTTEKLGAFGEPLKKLDGLRVGILATISNLDEANKLYEAIAKAEPALDVTIVAEILTDKTKAKSVTYSAADAIAFDGVIAALPNDKSAKDSDFLKSPLYPAGRPLQILTDAYRYAKPIGAVGESSSAALEPAGIPSKGEGVFTSGNTDEIVKKFLEGLKSWKFLDRLPIDEDADDK